jgi:hypothetical protein
MRDLGLRPVLRKWPDTGVVDPAMFRFSESEEVSRIISRMSKEDV